MILRAVLFDLDGTLADTLEDIAAAMNHALAEHALPTHASDAIRSMVGDGAAMLARRAVGARTDLEGPVLAAYGRYYAAHVVDRTAPYAGVSEALGSLAERDVPMAVLSNKPDAMTCAVVARLFPTVPFRAVRGERAGAPRKPDPTVATELAEALGHAPRETAFVGDTEIDMQTATAAGMVGVGACWGFRGEAALRTAGARVLLRTAAELPGLFAREGAA